MSDEAILSLVEKQEWLAPIEEKGQALVKDAFAAAGEQGQAVKNALHGVWLGHPLHPAVTDVPVGSWTAAAVLDVLEAGGQEKYGPGADAAIAVGLVGALGSAVSGLTDWSDTQGKARRVGALHGLLNGGATLLYGTSYVLRKGGNRGLGRAFGFAGYAVVLASAYLGGVLSYTQKIGVNHAPDEDEELPKEFKPVCSESEILEGQPKKADVDGTPLLLIRRNGEVLALADKCSHMGGPLSEGKIEGETVVCPWHGSRFCLKDGSVLDGPATTPQPSLEVRVQDGQVLVKARN